MMARKSVLIVVSVLSTLSFSTVAEAGKRTVSRRGDVGAVHLGAPMGEVRHVAGDPRRTSTIQNVEGHTAYHWRYPCGHGRSSHYYFDYRERLVEFGTTCRNWRTAAGTRIGMTTEEAETREGVSAAPGCAGKWILRRYHRIFLSLWLGPAGNTVTTLEVRGPHSVTTC
jgi:hypothetical protein